MEKSVITASFLGLGLETSGRVGSVSVGLGEDLSDEKSFSAPLRHSAELFDTIIELLKKSNKRANQIGYIYISIGPGSFTGIRISVTVAKMLALAAQSKIVAVSTTDAMALNVADSSINRIAAIIDAKREQFFVAVFERQDLAPAVHGGVRPPQVAAAKWQKILSDRMMTAEEFKNQFDNSEKPIWLLGEGLLYYANKFKSDNIKILDSSCWSPRAGNVFRVGAKMAAEGKIADPVSLVPFYLRRPEAEENWEKQKSITVH